MGGFKKAFKEALPDMAAGLATAAITGILSSKSFRSYVNNKLSFLMDSNRSSDEIHSLYDQYDYKKNDYNKRRFSE